MFEGFPIEMEDGVIAIGFDDAALAERAREIVRQHLEWFSKEHGVLHTVDLNMSWEMKPEGEKDIGLFLGDAVKVSDDVRVVRVAQATLQARSRIVTADYYDSAKLSTYSSLVEKSQRNPALAKALRYYAGQSRLQSK